MIDGYVAVLMTACLVLVAVGLLASLLSRPPGIVHLVITAAIEAAVLVQMVIATVGLLRGARVESLALFLAYAAFCVVVLPIGALFAFAERNRWSGAVFAVASLALVVTLWRLNALWVGTRG